MRVSAGFTHRTLCTTDTREDVFASQQNLQLTVSTIADFHQLHSSIPCPSQIAVVPFFAASSAAGSQGLSKPAGRVTPHARSGVHAARPRPVCHRTSARHAVRAKRPRSACIPSKPATPAPHACFAARSALRRPACGRTPAPHALSCAHCLHDRSYRAPMRVDAPREEFVVLMTV